ncbi:hypothetical protein YC2023_065630 [Brassica napus]
MSYVSRKSGSGGPSATYRETLPYEWSEISHRIRFYKYWTYLVKINCISLEKYIRNQRTEPCETKIKTNFIIIEEIIYFWNKETEPDPNQKSNEYPNF